MDNTSDDIMAISDDLDRSLGLGSEGGVFGTNVTPGDLPKRTAESPTRTAKPLEQGSEQARRNRRRAAGQATKLQPPKLGRAGLLGVGVEDIGSVI